MPASPSLADLLTRLRRDHTYLGITLYPPATEAELLAFEQHKGLQLPADVRAFYGCCNGLELNRELFRLIPLSEILKNGHDNYLLAPTDFHVAEDMIYADMWTLAVNTTTSEAYSIYNAGDETVLTTSFAEFLEVAAYCGAHGSGGLYDWQRRLAPPAATLPAALPTPAAAPPPPHKPWYRFW